MRGVRLLECPLIGELTVSSLIMCLPLTKTLKSITVSIKSIGKEYKAISKLNKRDHSAFWDRKNRITERIE